MALSESMKTGLMISVGIHLVALVLLGGIQSDVVSGTQYVKIDAAALDAVSVSNEAGVALGSFMNSAGPSESKLAARRRQAYLDYLEAVSLEIHSHRLDFGRTDLIGIVTYSFIVDAAGRFSNIRMLASSGWPELDRVAKLAIERSSGRVKRPRLIGAEPLAVVQEVRFQYGLH